MTALATALDVYPAGTPDHICIAHNRLRKATLTALRLIADANGHMTEAKIDKITDARMAAAARAEGEHEPNSQATRETIRAIMRLFVQLSTIPPHAPTTVQTPSDIADRMGAMAAQLAPLGALGIPFVVFLPEPVKTD